MTSSWLVCAACGKRFYGQADLEDHLARAHPTCLVCGAPAVVAQCRIRCQVCGYVRDCSDP